MSCWRIGPALDEPRTASSTSASSTAPTYATATCPRTGRPGSIRLPSRLSCNGESSGPIAPRPTIGFRGRDLWSCLRSDAAASPGGSGRWCGHGRWWRCPRIEALSLVADARDAGDVDRDSVGAEQPAEGGVLVALGEGGLLAPIGGEVAAVADGSGHVGVPDLQGALGLGSRDRDRDRDRDEGVGGGGVVEERRGGGRLAELERTDRQLLLRQEFGQELHGREDQGVDPAAQRRRQTIQAAGAEEHVAVGEPEPFGRGREGHSVAADRAAEQALLRRGAARKDQVAFGATRSAQASSRCVVAASS